MMIKQCLKTIGLSILTDFISYSFIFKNWFMLSVRISSYGCTREVWRARKKRKSCSSYGGPCIALVNT